jgi:hypothetical protein
MWGQNEQQPEEEVATSNSAQSILEPVKVLTDLDDKFNDLYNNIVGNLNTYNTYSSKMQSIEVQELSKQLYQKRTDAQEDDRPEDEKVDEDIKKLLGAADSDILGNLGEISVPTERVKRYQFYEEIPNINFIAYRMLKVYIDNILIKNVQTKQFLNINANPNNVAFLQTIKEDSGKHYENFLKTSTVYFDLQKKMKNRIVPDMLKYGNSFIEILNLKTVADIASHRELITESYVTGVKTKTKSTDFGYCIFESDAEEYVEKEGEYLEESVEDGEVVPVSTPAQQFKDLLSKKIIGSQIEEADTGYYSEITRENSEYNFDDINDLDFSSIQDIYLKNVSPNQVIIIEQDGILYGYLIVEDVGDGQGSEIDVFKRFTQQDNSKSTNNSEEEIRGEIIDQMTKGVVKKLNSTISNSHANNLDELNLSDSVESSIKIILYHKIKERAKLKFRFVSPNRLINFSTSVDKFGPYGTSIFDPIIQPVKMYTLALMSSIVSRLSRASVVRKWTIEAGNKKNHAEIIEKVKKDISNKSISFDSLSNVKNISKVITDFRDLATIQVNGQRFIDMEVMPMGDRSLPLNDMNDLRNELIAATGIPSVYLNIGDQVDLRETLVNLNTSFATTISSFQGNIDDSLSQLMNSIFSIVLENNDYDRNDFLLSNYYAFSLNPPLVLTVQANEALVSSVTNIIGMLKSAEITIDPKELLKLYIPQMNWDDLIQTGDGFIKKQAKDMLMQNSDDGGQSY